MTDQHQPAAAAPGLSEEWVGEHPMMPGDTPGYSAWVERLEPIAAQRVGWMNDRITELTDRLRAADADLARTRAEAAALRKALEWYADTRHYDDNFIPGRLVGGGWAGTEPQDADWDPDYGETARKALGLPDPWGQDAEPQSEQPQPAAPVAPSAEAKVADHVFVRRICCERCAFWWQVESKRTYCERPYEEHAGSRPAITPPDHQAGDEHDG